MDWCHCGRRWKTSEAIQRQGRGAGFYSSGHIPGMALGSVVKSAVGPYCGSGNALLIHDEFPPAGIETGAQFIVPAGIHPSKHRVPTPHQGGLLSGGCTLLIAEGLGVATHGFREIQRADVLRELDLFGIAALRLLRSAQPCVWQCSTSIENGRPCRTSRQRISPASTLRTCS